MTVVRQTQTTILLAVWTRSEIRTNPDLVLFAVVFFFLGHRCAKYRRHIRHMLGANLSYICCPSYNRITPPFPMPSRLAADVETRRYRHRPHQYCSRHVIWPGETKVAVLLAVLVELPPSKLFDIASSCFRLAAYNRYGTSVHRPCRSLPEPVVPLDIEVLLCCDRSSEAISQHSYSMTRCADRTD